MKVNLCLLLFIGLRAASAYPDEAVSDEVPVNLEKPRLNGPTPGVIFRMLEKAFNRMNSRMADLEERINDLEGELVELVESLQEPPPVESWPEEAADINPPISSDENEPPNPEGEGETPSGGGEIVPPNTEGENPQGPDSGNPPSPDSGNPPSPDSGNPPDTGNPPNPDSGNPPNPDSENPPNPDSDNPPNPDEESESVETLRELEELLLDKIAEENKRAKVSRLRQLVHRYNKK